MRKFFVILCNCLLFVSSVACADTVVNGDLKISGGGDLVFSNGSVQSTAQVQGPAGPANSLTIGTVISGTPAAASITGTSPNQTLNLTLPPIALPYSGSANTENPVLDITNTGTGQAGVFNTTNAANSSASVVGLTVAGIGVLGNSTGSGLATGVYGSATGTGLAGVFQILNNANSNPALYATTTGTGKAGFFKIDNPSNSDQALYAESNGSGFSINANAYGTGSAGNFHIENTLNNSPAINVQTLGTGQAAHFESNNSTVPTLTVRNINLTGQAAAFEGSIYVSTDVYAVGSISTPGTSSAVGDISSGRNIYAAGDLTSGRNITAAGNIYATGTLSAGNKQFHIDHPIDPKNKYLNHASIESNEMKNLYDGIVALDDEGNAVVTLPDWFSALNHEFRYQLTCIGMFAPVYIAEKMTGNRFKISGGVKGMEISWQVTGIRKDPWAKAHKVIIEEDKPEKDKGTCLHQEACRGI